MRIMERRGDLAGFDIVLAHAGARATAEPRHGTATPLPAWMGRLGARLGLRSRGGEPVQPPEAMQRT